MEKHANYINGEWVEARSGRAFENRNPANTEELVGMFPASTEEDVTAAVEAARRAKKKAEDLPQDSLGILALASGAMTKVGRVRSFQVPPKSGTWVAYLLERPRQKPDSTKATPPASAARPRGEPVARDVDHPPSGVPQPGIKPENPHSSPTSPFVVIPA